MFVFHSRHAPVLLNNLYLTYANDGQTDGAGAQLYRIYGIYALSRWMGASYIHSPIAQVDYQGLETLEGAPLDADFAAPFNKLCQIPSDGELPADHDVVTIRKPSRGFERKIIATKRPTLVRIVHPYRFLDHHPSAWTACRAISPFANPRPIDRKHLRVAIHVRRGDIHLVAPDRLLPNTYYISVAQRVRGLLRDLGLTCTLEIHTELPSHDLTVNPGDPAALNLKTTSHLDQNVDRIEDFRVLGEDMEFHINEPAAESFASIASADVIVTSKSAFSYLAGILNPFAATIYYPFWHKPLPTWVISNKQGHFNASSFRHALGLGPAPNIATRLHSRLNMITG